MLVNKYRASTKKKGSTADSRVMAWGGLYPALLFAAVIVERASMESATVLRGTTNKDPYTFPYVDNMGKP